MIGSAQTAEPAVAAAGTADAMDGGPSRPDRAVNAVRCVRYGFYILLLFLMPLLLSKNTTDPVGIKFWFSQALITVYLGFLVIHAAMSRRRLTLTVSVPLLMLAAWAVWEIAGHFMPVVRETEGNRLRLVLMALALTAITVLDRRFIMRCRYNLLIAGAAGALVVCLTALGEFWFPDRALYEYIWTHPSGTLGTHNLLAAYLIFQVAFQLAWAPFNGSWVKRSVWFGLLAVFVLTLFVSRSRTGLAALALCGVLYPVVLMAGTTRTDGRRTRRILQAALLVVPISIAGIAGFIAIERSSKSLHKQDYANSMHGRRFPIWESSVRMFRQHPIAGWGTGSFRSVFPAFEDQSLRVLYHEPVKDWSKTDAKTAIIDHAHNEFLQILCERGVVGLLLFSLLWISLAAAVLKKIRHAGGEERRWLAGLLVGVAAVLFQNLVSETLRYPSTLLMTALFAGFLIVSAQERIRSIRVPRFAGAVAAVFVAAAGFVSLSDTAARLRSDIAVQKALVLINSNRPLEALTQVLTAKRLNPVNPDVHYKEGYIRYLLADYSGSVRAYVRTLSMEPNFARAHYNLGCSLYKAGDLATAQREFLRALQQNPDNARTMHYLAKIFFQAKDYHSALAFSNKVVSVDGGDTEMLKMRDALVKAGVGL